MLIKPCCNMLLHCACMLQHVAPLSMHVAPLSMHVAPCCPQPKQHYDRFNRCFAGHINRIFTTLDQPYSIVIPIIVNYFTGKVMVQCLVVQSTNITNIGLCFTREGNSLCPSGRGYRRSIQARANGFNIHSILLLMATQLELSLF